MKPDASHHHTSIAPETVCPTTPRAVSNLPTCFRSLSSRTASFRRCSLAPQTLKESQLAQAHNYNSDDSKIGLTSAP